MKIRNYCFKIIIIIKEKTVFKLFLARKWGKKWNERILNGKIMKKRNCNLFINNYYFVFAIYVHIFLLFVLLSFVHYFDYALCDCMPTESIEIEYKREHCFGYPSFAQASPHVSKSSQ